MGEAMGKVFSRISTMRMDQFYGEGARCAPRGVHPESNPRGAIMETVRWCTMVVGLGLVTVGAYAQQEQATTLPSLPGDDAVATQQQQRALRTAPDRPTPLNLTPHIDVAVGEVPNVRVDPPSNDRRYDPR